MSTKTQSMIFDNTTSLPILVYSWREKMQGLSELKHIRIPANTRETVYSDTGEWDLSSEFFEKSDNEEWKKEGLEQFYRIAMFKTTPYVSYRSHTINNIEESFTIEHNEGVITWAKK